MQATMAFAQVPVPIFGEGFLFNYSIRVKVGDLAYDLFTDKPMPKLGMGHFALILDYTAALFSDHIVDNVRCFPGDLFNQVSSVPCTFVDHCSQHVVHMRAKTTKTATKAVHCPSAAAVLCAHAGEAAATGLQDSTAPAERVCGEQAVYTAADCNRAARGGCPHKRPAKTHRWQHISFVKRYF
jgi:hypothetical protein